MTDYKNEWDGIVYPDMILGLPEIDINLEGVRGWLMQNDSKQVVFFDIQPVGKVPPHSHCAQWGIMLQGEMSLTIGEKTKTYRKGDQYFIPEGTTHSAKFSSRVNVIDIFDAPDRYQAKLK